MAIKASASASIVSWAAIVWMRKLTQLLPEGSRQTLEGTNRMMKAVAFMSDATLDVSLCPERFP